MLPSNISVCLRSALPFTQPSDIWGKTGATPVLENSPIATTVHFQDFEKVWEPNPKLEMPQTCGLPIWGLPKIRGSLLGKGLY